MTAISAENWTTFFVLRWFFATSLTDAAIDERLHDGLEWLCEDDLGNKYEGGDYGRGGGGQCGLDVHFDLRALSRRERIEPHRGGDLTCRWRPIIDGSIAEIGPAPELKAATRGPQLDRRHDERVAI